MSLSENTLSELGKIILSTNQSVINSGAERVAEPELATLQYVLSPGNRGAIAGQFDLAEAKRQFEAGSGTRYNKQIVIDAYPKFNPRKSNRGAIQTDLCNFSGDNIANKIRTTLGLTQKTQAVYTMDFNNCVDEIEKVEKIRQTRENLFAQFRANFNADFWAEATRKENGKFVHFGALPKRNDLDLPRPAGSDVGIFMADQKTPNAASFIKIAQELSVAGISTDGYAVGGVKWDALARLMPGFSGADSTGFIPNSIPAPFLQNRNFSHSVAFETALMQAGIESPLMILKPGAWQIVTVSEFTATENFGQQMRMRIPIPGLGIEADYVIRLEICGKDVKYHHLLEVIWGFWSVPGCIVKEAMAADFLEDYNGVLLYNGVCRDENVCDITGFNAPMTAASVPIEDCAKNVEPCVIDTCSVRIDPTYNPDGSLVLTAFGTPVPPNSILSYQFKRNNVQVQIGTNPQLVITAANWANGDTFSVTIVTSDGCTSTASVVLNATWPMLQLLRNATPYASGSTLTVNQTVGAGNEITTINLTALSSAIVEVSAIAVSVSGTIAVPTPPVVPATPTQIINPAAQNIVLTTPRAAAGTATYTITVISNDVTTPAYELIVNVVIA